MKPWLQASGSNRDLDGHTGQFVALAVAGPGGLPDIATVAQWRSESYIAVELEAARPDGISTASGLINETYQFAFQLWGIAPRAAVRDLDPAIVEHPVATARAPLRMCTLSGLIAASLASLTGPKHESPNYEFKSVPARAAKRVVQISHVCSALQ